MSIRKNIFKNSLASGFQKLIKIGEQLLLIPFFLSAWGASYYGEWLTITAFPTIIGFSELGIGTAAANTVVLHFVAEEYAAAKRNYWLGLFLISITILLAFLLGGVGIFYLINSSLLDNLIINKEYAFTVLAILLFARVLNFYYALIEARFLIQRKAAQAINIRTLFSAIKLLAISALLMFDGKMLEVALVDLVITILILLVSLIFSWDAFNIFKKVKIERLFSGFKPLVIKGVYYLLNPIWQGLFFQGTTMIIRVILGTESVALFNTIRTLTRSAGQIFMLIEHSIFPELQYEYGRNNLIVVRKIFRLSFIVSLIVGVLSTLFLGFWGLPIYSFWTNGLLDPPILVWWILVAGIFANGLWWTTLAVFRAANQPEKFAKIGVLSALISLGIAYWLTKKIGMTGAAISMLIMELLMLFFLIPAGCKIINQNLSALLIEGSKDFSQISKKYFVKKNV